MGIRELYQRLCLSGIAVAALGLSACDQREERLQRAQELGGAVLDQITGNETGDTARNLRDVPIEARAMAGTMASPVENDAAPAPASRYVIGSIVAKPRDLPPPIAMASVMAEPELADEIVVGDTPSKIVVLDKRTLQEVEADPEKLSNIEGGKGKVTVVDPRVRAKMRPLTAPGKALPRAPLREAMADRAEAKDRAEKEAQGIFVPPPPEMVILAPAPTREQQIAALPKLKPEMAKRAITLRSETLSRQLSAEDRMIETASKYGVAASIQRSRSGQMKIEIGAGAMNPTQFKVQNGPDAIFAMEGQADCDAETVEAAGQNPLVAMECIIDELQASGEFEYVEKDYVFEHQMIRKPKPDVPSTITPNDPLFDLQWHYGSQGTGEQQMPGASGFVDFWTKQNVQDAGDVVVAVIDTGIQMDHPEMKASPNILPGWDMVSDVMVANDNDGRDSDANDPGDACPEQLNFTNTYHGTHVAGTLGAGVSNNGMGVAGGAWNIKVVPVRALGKCGGAMSDINDAIRWAAGTIPEYDELNNEVWNDNPADIINLSIGLFRADRTCPASMQDAIDAVTAEGVIVVVAAGNKRIPIDYFAPAGCRNVVTVAAGDARGYLTPYSNYGAGVDLLAPGGDLTRDDNGDKKPDGVLSTKTAENCLDPVTGQAIATCFYAYEQGTSMAAPHVSAGLALIKSQRPDLTASELVALLQASLTPVPQNQCMGACSRYPGAQPMADNPDMCLRPCGEGLLNLGNVDLSE